MRAPWTFKYLDIESLFNGHFGHFEIDLIFCGGFDVRIETVLKFLDLILCAQLQAAFSELNNLLQQIGCLVDVDVTQNDFHLSIVSKSESLLRFVVAELNCEFLVIRIFVELNDNNA